MADDSALMKVLSFAVDVDVPSVRGFVADLKEKHPGLSNEALAKRVFSSAGWKAAASGAATGLPANPWVAVPAAVADAALVLRIEVVAAARTAIIYDPSFFDHEDAQWELLIPVFGLNAASQFLREAGVRAGMGVTREMIKKYLSKETLRTFQKVLLKYFGLKVTQRAVIAKTVPVIGGVIGGTWNFVEVRLLRARSIAYFAGRSM